MDRSFTVSQSFQIHLHIIPTWAAYDKELASAQNGAEVLEWLDMSGEAWESTR